MKHKKYVRYENGVFVLFSNTITHRHIARGQLLAGPPISAGFFIYEPGGEVHCFGRSVSPPLNGLPDDTEALHKFLNE